MISQVSKAGAAKILLAIKHGDGQDVKFDFTGAGNGESWRNTFKEAIASAMASLRGGGVPASAPAQDQPQCVEKASAAGGGGVETLDISQVSKYFEEFPK